MPRSPQGLVINPKVYGVRRYRPARWTRWLDETRAAKRFVVIGSDATSASSPGVEQIFALAERFPRIVDPAALLIR